jgi:hypothetical protein
LLIGAVAACGILWFARRTYMVDYERQKLLGTFAVE